jgi:hypothetical protein
MIREKGTATPMPTEELARRLARVHSAIRLAEEADLSKFPAQVHPSDRCVAVLLNFSGDLRQSDIENHVYTAIHNIAHLYDHIRRWAAKNGRDKSEVDLAREGSFAIRVVTDLSNNDKHGYPPRDGGRSKRAPRLTDVRRILRLTTGSAPKSLVGVTLSPRGALKIVGDGSAKVVITGTVVDKDDATIGEIEQLCDEALKAWENLLHGFGAAVPDMR